MSARRVGRYIRWEGMCWPSHVEKEDDSVEWRLRYGREIKREDILYACSVMSAYRALIEASAKKRAEVVRVLKNNKD